MRSGSAIDTPPHLVTINREGWIAPRSAALGFFALPRLKHDGLSTRSDVVLEQLDDANVLGYWKAAEIS